MLKRLWREISTQLNPKNSQTFNFTTFIWISAVRLAIYRKIVSLIAKVHKNLTVLLLERSEILLTKTKRTEIKISYLMAWWVKESQLVVSVKAKTALSRAHKRYLLLKITSRYNHTRARSQAWLNFMPVEKTLNKRIKQHLWLESVITHCLTLKRSSFCQMKSLQGRCMRLEKTFCRMILQLKVLCMLFKSKKRSRKGKILSKMPLKSM